MFRRWAIAFTIILFSVVLVACNTATNPPTANSNTAPNVAERVVTLTSLSSDIVSQLDKSKLVGITGSKLFDKDARFQGITQVSKGQSPPNLEKIVALKPDLVVGNKDFHAQILPKLKELGIATLATDIDKWDDLASLTKTLAQAIGANPAPLLTRYQTFLGKPTTSSLSTLALVSRQPILAPNKSSWAGDLLSKFGVKNIVADLQGKSPVGGYVTLSAEKVLEANPDVLLLVDTGQGIVEKFKSEPFWGKLKATQRDRIYVFDYYGLVNPGSIDKIEQACNQLRKIFSQ
jgi:iron complex transport system substrate-binding protein